MNAIERTGLIVGRVRAKDRLFGRPADPTETSSGKPGRMISDDGSWKALIVPGHTPARDEDKADGSGADWDLFQLWVHGSLRVTAHLRGDDIAVRLYKSGSWEEAFLLFGLPDLTPVLPGGYVGLR